jgi:formylglycine-generating enzyme required for sulfatase activity
VKDTATQIELMLIPPGTFQMGCSVSNLHGCWAGENPVHTVTLTNPFYMARFEVTQAQWQAWMGSNPSYHQSPSVHVPAAQVAHRPVEWVGWDTIQVFLGQTGMRLPREAEWEYAYRAGTATAVHGHAGNPSGTSDDHLGENIAWYFRGTCSNGAACQTRPVGGKLAKGYGLHDMSGTVIEWVNDSYSSTYYSTSPQYDPTGPEFNQLFVLRGGSFFSESYYLRASYRYGAPANFFNLDIGFRVARNP